MVGSLAGLRKLEVVQVSGDHDECFRIRVEDSVDKVPHHLGLILSLNLGDPHGRLVHSEQRIVPELALEMVANNGHDFALDVEVTHQRLAAARAPAR